MSHTLDGRGALVTGASRGIGAAIAAAPARLAGEALGDRLCAVNVRAPRLLIAALVPSMQERGGGSIVNLSSVSGIVGTPRRAVFLASDAARFITGETISADGGMAKTLDLYGGAV